MTANGIFVDASEYRRNNFDFRNERLAALMDFANKDWITFLQTDVSVSEIKGLIHKHVKEACEVLKNSKTAIFKYVDDDCMAIFRDPPNAERVADILSTQFYDHLRNCDCNILKVSHVDPAIIFDAYFNNVAPFDNPKKRREFPDAFTLQRLSMWADEHETIVYVVGPDDDLNRACNVQEKLKHFNKMEALLNNINCGEVLVQKLHQRSQELIDALVQFVYSNFADRLFVPEFNPHGDVENVTVADVEVGDIYALELIDGHVRAEAEAIVKYNADVTYEDFDTGFYDKETKRHYMTDYKHLSTENETMVSVLFDFYIDESDRVIISEISIPQDTISVREEDRGDYGFWK